MIRVRVCTLRGGKEPGVQPWLQAYLRPQRCGFNAVDLAATVQAVWRLVVGREQRF